MPAEKVVEHFNRVEEQLVNTSGEDRSPRFLQNMAGELLVVIQEAGGTYPEAHARLSEVFFALGDKKRAEQEYKTALQQDPYEPVAWNTRMSIALAPYVGHTEFRLGSQFVPTGGGIAEAAARDLGGQRYEAAVIKEFKQLLQTYRQLVATTTNASAWINMSEVILQTADFLHQNNLVWHKGSWPNLYEDVANAPWNKVEGMGYDQAIADIRQTAQGRMLLYPSSKSAAVATKSTQVAPQGPETKGTLPIERPKQITPLTVLAAFKGILGLLSFAASPFSAIVGVLDLIFAYGAWTVQPWAWVLGFALQGISVLLSLMALCGTLVSSNSVLAAFGQVIVGIILPLVILVLLLDNTVKAAFGRT